MSTQAETETRSKSAQVGEGWADGPGSFGLVHLAACLGAGGAAVLAVNLIEWLT